MTHRLVLAVAPTAGHAFRDSLYDVEIRRVICSTNAIESLNARYRMAVSTSTGPRMTVSFGPTWCAWVEFPSSSALPLSGGVFFDLGSATAVGGLAAGWGAEALDASVRGVVEESLDAEDDEAPAALAAQAGAGKPLVVGWQR